MKGYFLTIIGCIGSGITYLLGGWDSALITLLIFMCIDFITGLILAGIYHKSSKTKTGAIESKVCWKGLAKKMVTLMFIVIANRLDMMLGTSYIKDGVCIAFIVNELISIIENAGLMGVPIPDILKRAIEMLKKEGELNEERN